MKRLFIFSVAVFMLLAFSACGIVSEKTEVTTENTSSAVLFDEDATVGSGERQVNVIVTTPEKTYSFTILTDATILGEALVESGLADGEEGPYGLYITSVNGIQAIYEVDNSYWALSVDGEAASTGADSVSIEDGRAYELVYTIMR